MASADDPWLTGNTNHVPKEQVKSKFAESKLPKFKFVEAYRSPKPQVSRMVSKYIDYLNTLQDARESSFNTLQDTNLSKESAANASQTINKKLRGMVKLAKKM